MVVTMALSLFCATVLFGAVTIDFAAVPFALVFLLTLLWAGKLFFSKTVSFKFSPIHGPVLAFFLYTVIRYWTSPVEYDSRIELFQVGLYTLVYFLAASNFYHSRDRSILIGSLMILALLESAYGLWQMATRADTVLLLNRPLAYNGRASGTFICPNHLAGFLEMVLGLLAGRAVFHHGRLATADRNTIGKVLIVYVAIMAVGGIFVSYSRAGWAATLVGLLALLLWGDWRLRAGWPRLAMVGLVVAVFVGVAFLIPSAYQRIKLGLLTDSSGGGRTLMWNSTLNMIKDAPLLGTGPGTWQWIHQLYRNPQMQAHPVYAHSDVLHVFSDYGLVGGLLVVAFFGCYFWQVAVLAGRRTSSDKRSFAIGGAIGVISILAHSWVDFNLHIPANALLLVTIVGFTAAMEDKENRFRRVALGRWTRIGLGLVLVGVSLFGAWKVGCAALAFRYAAKGEDAKEILEWDLALDYYQRAIALDPSFSEPYAKSGDILRSQSEWRLGPEKKEERRQLAQKAVDFFQLALSQNPYQSEVLLRLASAYQLLSETNLARQTFERARKVDPKSSLVYLRMGLFYRRLGEEDKAAETFRKSEELNPGGDDISRLNLEEILPRP
jgi:O-antigen ligase